MVGVAGFASLEEDVRVLSGTAQYRMLRVQSMLAELLNSVHVHHVLEVLVIPNFDLLDLVRSTETIEEVQERNSGLQSGQVSNSTQVHNFLNRAGAEHCVTSLTAGIYVRVIAEDAQSVGSDGTSRYVNNARQQLTSDLVHVGDHQEQTLGSGVSGGQGTSSQRAVYGTGSASLRLHLYQLYGLAEDVLLTLGSPLVAHFCHYGRRSDRVDGSNICKRIGNMSRSVVTIHGFHFSCHVMISSLWIICWHSG